jgi:hypothetical protein
VFVPFRNDQPMFAGNGFSALASRAIASVGRMKCKPPALLLPHLDGQRLTGKTSTTVTCRNPARPGSLGSAHAD